MNAESVHTAPTEPGSWATEAAPERPDRTLDALATVSHEMRTALGGILGMVTLLAEETADPIQRRHIEALRSAAETLHRLVDDVVDLARLDADGFAIETRPLAVADLVAGLVDLERPRAKAKGLALEATVAPEVPATLLGDPVRIRQVLANLVGNAIKFTERGGITIEVAVAARNRSGVTLSFVVADTGPGIPADEAATLFARFGQGDGGRRRGGAGLGLWICRALVERMGGAIGIDAAPGEGSRLRFTVPLGLAEAEVPADPPRAPGPMPALNLLLAEDNEINRMFVATILERAGHRVDVVATGAQAVAMARWTVYDAILMDLNMPVLDGFEATRAIRALGDARGRVPIIALTADALSGDRERCLAAGMTDHVAKPVDPARLAVALGRATAVPK